MTDTSNITRVFDDLLQNTITPHTAATTIAQTGTINDLWGHVLKLACDDTPQHQDKLVDFLVHLSRCPDSGEPVIKWRDLPTLGWDLRDEWNFNILSDRNTSREKAITHVVNLNRFTALLMATKEPVFDFAWFALVTFRDALESEPTDVRHIDALIPAAAAWIEVLGVQIYSWDRVWESGPTVGKPGRGGPLWSGKHGFCPERWQLWRRGFAEVAAMDGVGENTKIAAREAELMMKEIEDGHVA